MVVAIVLVAIVVVSILVVEVAILVVLALVILFCLLHHGQKENMMYTLLTKMALLLELFILQDMHMKSITILIQHKQQCHHLSSCNQQCAGLWFICASLQQPYKSYKTGDKFSAELILLMGVKSFTTSLYCPGIRFITTHKRKISLRLLLQMLLMMLKLFRSHLPNI